MPSLNPFHTVIDNQTHLLAHARRTSFGEKMWATFKVYSGALIKPHLGIYDYLTLGIPYLLTLLFFPNGSRPDFILFSGFLLCGIISLPRLLFAATMTFLSIPIVIAIHAATKSKGAALQEVVTSYIIENSQSITDKKASDDKKPSLQTIGELLQQHNCSINEIVDIQVQQSTNPQFVTLTFFGAPGIKPKKELSELSELKLCCHDIKHKALFRALKKLNVGELQTKIESGEEKYQGFRGV